MPIISIIVPVYNVEKYLHCCIHSILAQTITDIEVLLVNDGSTDSSGTICDEYAKSDSRVRVFHKENGGVSSARNLGLDKATGKWIMFVDSDDKVAPQICERLLSEATEGCMPLCMWYDWHDEEFALRSLGVEKGRYPVNQFTKIQWHGPYARLYERRLLECAGLRFDERFAYTEDAIFNFEYYALIEAFVMMDEPLYYYRILPNSLSHGKYIPDFERIITTSQQKRISLAERLKVNDTEFYRDYFRNYAFFLAFLFRNNMHKDSPESWYEKIKRNNAVLRSEEFRAAYPYRHEWTKAFTKRYIRVLELSYHTGSYIWLWLLGLLGKIKSFISEKR